MDRNFALCKGIAYKLGENKMKKRIIVLNELESEKVNACIMLVAKDFEIQCYKNEIDINGNEELAQKARFYSGLAKKFERDLVQS